MDKLYRFSPIHNEVELFEAVTYIAQEATKLGYEVVGETYEIGSLTVFSHYQDEFEELKKLVLTLGKIKKDNNGPFVTLDEPYQIPNNYLQLLRIRKPDPYRMQVGCCDFKVSNYMKFKSEFIGKKEGLRVIERPGYEMVEFYNPDCDVLAYVVSEELG